ncbi:MAG: plasmid stabilization protein [Chloroflexi bacterium]|nr:plasmid stabilization protein [Chloroflexota bacterium]
MTSITVRNIEDDLKRRLRIRAAEHGHSMEEEARRILRAALGEDSAPEQFAAREEYAALEEYAAPEEDGALEKDLGTAIHELFAPIGGVDGIEFPRLAGLQPVEFR